MLSNRVFYHGVIRKTIVGFGALFSNISIERRLNNSVTGEVQQTLKVPIAYGPKEKWLVRQDSDPTLDNHTYTSMPRMSFEILGYNYDSQRKVNKMNRIFCGSGSEGASITYSPVPYNLDLALYILTKTNEDSLQILEQILPTFQPEYTLSIRAIPEMNVVLDVPLVINSVSVQDDFEGDFIMRRQVIHTLSFTAKLNLFGNVTSQGLIETAIAGVGEDPTGSNPMRIYTAIGDPETGEISEGWIDGL